LQSNEKYIALQAKYKLYCIMKKFLLAVACLVAFNACNLDQYNNSDQKKLKDKREGSIYVYGVKGDSARQLRQQYPVNKEANERAKAIREKLYGGSTGSNLQDGTVATDTTKKADTTKKEGTKAVAPKK
jgi:hypothetical protein